ncbi:hypothetical protein VPH35_034718 [Triticum aestivum]
MADPRPFTNIDPAMAPTLRRNGYDPHKVDQFVEHVLAYIYTLIHRLPFTDKGRLTAFAASTDGVDRISSLPDELLRNIIARLPVKDLARWIQLLAANGVQDLVLVNRPWPEHLPLLATLFSVSTLTSLYIGFRKLLSTDVLRGVSFDNLVELSICSVEMEHNAIESLVVRSPVLEILNTEGCRRERRLCLSRSWCFRVRIVDAHKLHTFGYLEPGQVLEVGKMVIMPGSTSTMLTTVKILSLNVRFGVRSDVKMVPTFLRCFPNVERLHIMSQEIVVLLEKNEDLEKKLGVFMGDPAPGDDDHPEDYIIVDDTDSDPDRSDDDYKDEARADIMESSTDQNF